MAGSSGVPPLRYYWLSDGAALLAGPLDTVAQPGTGQEITQTRATTRNRNIGTGYSLTAVTAGQGHRHRPG